MFQIQMGETSKSAFLFLDVLSTCVLKVSLGEARMYISQDGLLNKKTRLGYRVGPWPKYN